MVVYLSSYTVCCDFKPHSPCRERLAECCWITSGIGFQPTLLTWGATARARRQSWGRRNFNPRPHTGSDGRLIMQAKVQGIFQSTPPMRGATPSPPNTSLLRYDFNPRSPYGERRHPYSQRSLLLIFQSTLPIRGATHSVGKVVRSLYISIHAPHTGSDPASAWLQSRTNRFQSTLPIRGATRAFLACPPKLFNFNPRSPYGERRQICPHRLNGRWISIHAPHTGSDFFIVSNFRPEFISIHAPHTGSDRCHTSRDCGAEISIHAPHTGSDKITISTIQVILKFQSTLPIRGATGETCELCST